jgi:uncharacterized membrane protein YhiD involved in acid resistance
MTKLTVDDFLSGFNLTIKSSLTVQDILLCLLITFMISLFIYYIYRKTYSGVIYSREFNVTLIIISMVVAVIMLGISRNLALSLGMIGALSIVRFRSAIKDPRDITFLFWSISIGIVNGVQFYKLSITSSLIIGILLVILSKKLVISEPYLLIIRNQGKIERIHIEKILKKYCKKYKIRNYLKVEGMTETTIELKIKKNKEDALLEEFNRLDNIQRVNMFSHSGQLGD